MSRGYRRAVRAEAEPFHWDGKGGTRGRCRWGAHQLTGPEGPVAEELDVRFDHGLGEVLLTRVSEAPEVEAADVPAEPVRRGVVVPPAEAEQCARRVGRLSEPLHPLLILPCHQRGPVLDKVPEALPHGVR